MHRNDARTYCTIRRAITNRRRDRLPTQELPPSPNLRIPDRNCLLPINRCASPSTTALPSLNQRLPKYNKHNRYKSRFTLCAQALPIPCILRPRPTKSSAKINKQTLPYHRRKAPRTKLQDGGMRQFGNWGPQR
jgi:hypothetical protein